MKESSPNSFGQWCVRTWPAACLAIAVAIGVFVMPWHVGREGEPARSFSYTYGFNNLAADLVVAAGLIAVFLYWLRRAGAVGWLGALHDLMPNDGPPAGGRELRITFAVVSVVVLGSVALFYNSLPCAYFGETSYFIPRLDLLHLGLSAYRDFQFNLGPEMLYLPGTLQVVGGGQLSVEGAYLLALLIHWELGLYFIYYILSRLRGNFARATIFFLVAAAFFNLTLGLHYTPLRFLLPMAALIFLHGRTTRLANWFTLFLAPAAGFALSPDIGLVTCLGFAAYHVLRAQGNIGQLLGGLALLLGAGVLVGIAFSPAYFRAVLAVAAGGNNFPIFPTLTIVCFLAAVFCTLPALAAAGWRNRTPAGALAVGLTVSLALLVPVSLGRCDPFHVAFNGAGVFLLCLAALSATQSRLFTPALIAGVTVFCGVSQLSFWNNYQVQLKQVQSLRNFLSIPPEARSGYTNAPGNAHSLVYSKALPVPEAYGNLLRYEKLGAPLGCSESLERFLKLHGKFASEYFVRPEITGLTISDRERKLRDLRGFQAVVVPAGFLAARTPPDLKTLAELDATFLSGLMVWPIRLQPLREPFNPAEAVILVLQREFSPVETIEDYVVLVRKPGAP